MTTVSNGDRKDTDMKLLLIFAAILAFSLAEEEKKSEVLDDFQAEASAAIELMKEGADLNAAASTYNTYVPPSQRPPHWNAPNYVPPQNTWQPPKPIQTVQTGVPANVQSDYYEHHHHHVPTYHPPTTTTPVAVLKDERYFGENGYYKYEYEIADGTSAGEEGYFTDPKHTDESLVKKGWYSYVGGDRKVYTVHYWADHTGYHAYGDHLPTPPPATQPAIDQGIHRPQHDYPIQTPAPIHYPTQTPPPVYYPTQTPAPVHYPTQTPPPVYYPTQTAAPVYYPTPAPYVPPQHDYVPPQQPSNPPQQQYYPPLQQNYYPQQPTNQV